jgi:hypothetical protein
VGFHGVGGGRFSDAAHRLAARPCAKFRYEIHDLALVQKSALFFVHGIEATIDKARANL